VAVFGRGKTDSQSLTESPLPSPGDGWNSMRSSLGIERLLAHPCPRTRFFSVQAFVSPFLLGVICLFASTTAAFAQDSVAPSPVPAATPTTQPESKESSVELTSHDEPTTFKVNVKLVVVRAVVRDSQGHAVGTLKKEDFQVFDKGKPQVITQFEVEQPGTLTAKAREKSEQTREESSGEGSANSGDAAAVPERFVAYLFDDVHIEFGDLAQVRNAAERHFSTLRPTDRAAILTTSGLNTLDYTDDRTKLHAALFRLRPQPVTGSSKDDCPDISYYQADQIVNQNDVQATDVALQEAAQCIPPVPGMPPPNPLPLVMGTSMQALSEGEHETRISLAVLKDVVNNLARKPGQRSVVLVSPGFIAPKMEYEYTDIIDRAVHSQIVISALDARGLYTSLPFGDISKSPQHPPPPAKALIESAAASAQGDLLAVLADGTGGVFFHNSNDYGEGFRRVAETPEYSYVLAFAPQNLKLDGSFHGLKVTVKSPQKVSLQARRGYYAPKKLDTPEDQAKRDIEDAMFSQEEMHNLPVNLHTQFFKSGEVDAKLVVLAHVDVRHLHFRKADGRNNNTLTCVSGVFNRNGSFLQGMAKTVTLHLKDDTLEHKLASGLTLKTSFDVKPGSYLVRLVVRDAEGQLMSAENGTVEIR
jgi:VWFA-related protein